MQARKSTFGLWGLLALGLTGLAGCLAGGKLFRWDAQQRFAALRGKAWLVVAVAAWAAVGLLAELRGRIRVPVDAAPPAPAAAAPSTPKAAARTMLGKFIRRSSVK